MDEIRKDLWEMKYIQGTGKTVYCTAEEESEIKNIVKEGKPIPADVLADECGAYFRYENENLTEEEIRELVLYRQLENQEKQNKHLNIIKGLLIYMAILSSIIVFTILYMYIGNLNY